MSRVEKLAARCDKVMAFSFYALVYFLPISIALTETFSGLAIFFYLLKRGALFFYGLNAGSRRWASFFSSVKPAANCLNKPVAIFLVANFFTVIASQFPRASIEGFVGKTLEGALMYFAFLETISTRKRMKIFVAVFAVSFVVICASGLYQYFLGHDFIRGHIFDGRISSSFRAANDFAAYLVVTTLILFYLLLSAFSFASLSPRESRFILAFLFLLSFVCLILTYSRGAWVAFIVTLAIWGLKSPKVFVSSIIILFIFILSFFHQSSRVLPSELSANHSWTRYWAWENNRLGYWKRSVSIIKDYPLLGSGVNTYSSIQWRYETGWGGYPHNSYLQMAAETGVIGLLTFLGMIAILLKNAFRNLKRVVDPSGRLLLLSFLAGLTGFLTHSFVDTNFYSVQLSSLLWLIMGVIVSLQHIEQVHGTAQGRG